MRVKLLSGNQAGQIVDAPDAPILISNGLAERAPLETPAGSVVSILDRQAAAPEPEGGSLVDEDGDDAITEKTDPDDTVPARVRRRSPQPKPSSPASRRKRR